jgi:hypothetical protein
MRQIGGTLGNETWGISRFAPRFHIQRELNLGNADQLIEVKRFYLRPWASRPIWDASIGSKVGVNQGGERREKGNSLFQKKTTRRTEARSWGGWKEREGG